MVTSLVFFYLALCFSVAFLVWHNLALTQKNEENWEYIKELISERNEARDAFRRSRDDIAELLNKKPTKQKEPTWDTMAR
jgi:hypothetical protein